MDNTPPPQLTPQERGDTLGQGSRVALFVIVTIAVLAIAGAIVFASDRMDATTPKPTRPVTSPQPTATTKTPDAKTADIPARKVASEDSRIWRAVDQPTPSRDTKTTVVLDERDTTYTLDDLIERGAAKRSSSRLVSITKHVVLRTGAELDIYEPGTTINMVSTPQRFTSIVAWGGSISLRGSAAKPIRIRSWDSRQRAADRTVSDGRAYIRAHSGDLVLRNATVERLGFWSGRTGGLAVTGTNFDRGTASLTRTTASNTHMGLYLMQVSGARVIDSHFTYSQRHGIEVDRSSKARITGGSITHVGGNGVQAHDDSNGLTVTRTKIHSNSGYAVMADGRAKATGPNTQGHSTRNSHSLTIRSIQTHSNLRGGLRIAGMDRTAISGSRIDEAFRPIHIVGPSDGTTVATNRVTSGRGAVVLLTSRTQDVKIRDNTLNATTSGVWASDADLAVAGNTVTVRMGHGLVFGPNVRGSARDNVFKGKGPSSIKWSDDQRRVSVSGNTAHPWDKTHPLVDWLEHNPFAALWLLILVLPVTGIVFIARRVRQHRNLRRLTEETVIAMAHARRMAERGLAPTVGAPTPLPEPAPTPEAEPEPAAAPEPAPTREPAPAPAPRLMPVSTRQAAEAPAHVDRHIRRGAMGQFLSARDLAIHAVLEGGRSPEHVARTLQVTPAQIRHWVQAYLEQQQP